MTRSSNEAAPLAMPVATRLRRTATTSSAAREPRGAPLWPRRPRPRRRRPRGGDGRAGSPSATRGSARWPPCSSHASAPRATGFQELWVHALRQRCSEATRMRATGCWLGSSRPPTRSSRAPPKPPPGAPSRRRAAGVSAARRRGCRRAWPSRRAAALAVPCRPGRGVARPSPGRSCVGWGDVTLTGREAAAIFIHTIYRAAPSVLYTLGAALLFLRLSRAHSNIHPPRVRPTRTGTAPHAPTPGPAPRRMATRRGATGPRDHANRTRRDALRRPTRRRRRVSIRAARHVTIHARARGPRRARALARRAHHADTVGPPQRPDGASISASPCGRASVSPEPRARPSDALPVLSRGDPAADTRSESGLRQGESEWLRTEPRRRETVRAEAHTRVEGGGGVARHVVQIEKRRRSSPAACTSARGRPQRARGA